MHLHSRIIPVHKIVDVYPIVADNLTGIEIQDKVGIIELNMSFRDFSLTLQDVINNNLDQGDDNAKDNNGGREATEEGHKSPDSRKVQSGKNNPSNDPAGK